MGPENDALHGNVYEMQSENRNVFNKNRYVEGMEQEGRMTNGDKIRAMTDEELAMILEPTCPSRVCRDDPPHDCYKCWLDWLKEDAE